MASPAKLSNRNGEDTTLLSSVAIQGTVYNLVATNPKNVTDDSLTRPSTCNLPHPKVQRARKSFPTAQSSTLTLPALKSSATAALQDIREKQVMANETVKPHKSSSQESDNAHMAIPALIPMVGEVENPAKKKRVNVSLSEQSTVMLEEPVASPHKPAPLSSQADPVFAEMAALMGENVDDDEVSSTVRPITSSPNQATSKNDSDREALNKSSDEEYLPPPKVLAKSSQLGRSPPSKVLVESPPMEITSGVAASSNKRSRASRELENLYIDEGAERILSEMARRGSNRRPIKNPNIPSLPLPSAKVAKPRKSSPRRHPPRPKLDEAKKSKLKKVSPVTNGVREGEGKGYIDQWQAVKSSKPDGSTVYVPCKIMNPANVSNLVQRRSYPSSGSSTEDEATFRQKQQLNAVCMIPAAANSTSPMVPSPRLMLSSPASGSESPMLNGRGYSRMTQEVGVGATANRGGGAMSTYSSTEIKVRLVDRHLLHVTLTPSRTNSTSPHNSLNANVLKEIVVLLRQVKAEKDVHVILVTSGGPEFCTGIDISTLISDSIPVRKENARILANIIQEFVVELANCDKMLVCGVNGSAVGLGVTMLRYFDSVFSSDTSTFSLPYTKLAQGTEGGAALVLQNSATSNNMYGLMLYHGRRLNAEEAKTAGLINEVIGMRSSFLEVLIPQVRSMAALSSQAMLATKKNLRQGFRRKLPAILMNESKLLREYWPSEDFQRRAAAILAARQLPL